MNYRNAIFDVGETRAFFTWFTVTRVQVVLHENLGTVSPGTTIQVFSLQTGVLGFLEHTLKFLHTQKSGFNQGRWEALHIFFILLPVILTWRYAHVTYYNGKV
jgi:hypothetical protein